MLELQPISYGEAVEFIDRHHRHHGEPNRRAHKFSIAVNDGKKIVGVAMTGRPVARFKDDGWTLEVHRNCTDGTKNAASMLYGACWRAARALGYKRLITYTLIEESGTSLKAAGWKVVGQTKGGTWNRKARPRIDKHPIGQKTIWEASKLGGQTYNQFPEV
jgi:hypothetical protein